MKKLSSDEIRKIWLDYFSKNDHFKMESASLIPINDKSLLWINSGVATLKKYFSGQENAPYPNLVNSQKAIRTNDIFNVGKTSKHHTFFEMLGSFSIGGYFKEKAIKLAYDLLVNEFEIDVNKLYITVFEDDLDAYNFWLKLKIDKNKIIKCNRERNFWDVGSGPCGPCSEIFYDRGIEFDPENIGEKLFFEDIENDRYIEIWNIVFSEYNNDGENNYTPLERKNIDTGAGLERITAISQSAPTNFDTDLFLPIINEIEKFTKKKYVINSYFDTEKNSEQTSINQAYKIISDHIRTICFAIADGAIPSNKERGYILRRLIRRIIVMLYKLDIKENIFPDLTTITIKNMNNYYPYLKDHNNKMNLLLNNEYISFNKTLINGIKLFEEAIEKSSKLDKNTTFKLVETYGFPIDLIKELASEKNIEIDINGFNELFSNHQKISNSNQSKIALLNQNGELLNLHDESIFINDKYTLQSKIIKLYDEDFKPIDHLIGDGYVIFDQTCFYSTSGGQLHDFGTINNYEVHDVFKGPNQQHIHHVLQANLKQNQTYELVIDEDLRKKVTRNHSVEHLIHAALGELVDKNIKQEGAFKSPSKVTFDFQHHERLTDEKIKEVENRINTIINSNTEVNVLKLTLDEAKEIGAKAYFEDIYKKIKGKLRVIKMGDFSVELCGGTHVSNTNDIEQFKIVEFYPNGAGSWRMGAITSFDTIDKYLKNKVNEINNEFNVIKNKVNKFIIINKEFINEIDSIKLVEKESELNLEKLNKIKSKYEILKVENNKKITSFEIDEIKKQVIKNEKFINIKVFNFNSKNIGTALSEIINENKSMFIALLNITDDKIKYIFAVNDVYAKENNFNLNSTIKIINEQFNGKGGGKFNYVQGGSNEITRLKEIEASINNEFKNLS